ncbi:MAG: PKD domain-containing protein [Flavisolibacter sp.]|nr:PKD domain-containing protein [Flavisolibacter sp.]
MLIIHRISGTVLLLLICIFSFAQNLSNKGKEFFVGYGHHQFFENNSNTQEMVLYLSAEQAAVVTITIGGTGYSQTYNIPANTVISTAPIPKAGVNDARLYNTSNLSEGIFNRGIRISSNVPIVAYSHIYGLASSGATMLMPTDTWGYAYKSVNSYQRYSGNNCFSWFYVVAKENNTVIEITPSVPTRGGKAANVPFTVTLNKGQIYQILGALINGNDGYEMTGTRVRSIANAAGDCYPIAAFSGSSRTQNPTNCGTASIQSGGGDNDMQQLFPSQAWGKRYLVAPTSTSASASQYQSNRWKIVVQDPNTVVKRNGIEFPQTQLVNNTYYTFEAKSVSEITASKPVMVAQFMSGGIDCRGNGSVGDPEMIIISPVEQGINRIGFYKNDLEDITVTYLTMIIPQAGLSSLTIDGQLYPAGVTHSFDHSVNAGYKVVIKRWAPASSNTGQCIVQSDSAFTAITYGMGSVESYGYNAGTLINNLTVIGNLYNTPDTTVNTHDFTCINTPIEISMGVAYPPTSMTWQLSQVPSLSPNADITVNNPVPSFTSIVNGISYYHYTLPGTFNFSDTGTFVIPVRNSHPSIENCNNSEVVTFALQVKPKPKIDFSFIHTGCVKDSVQFNSAAQTMNGYNISSWKWTFDDASIASGQNPKKLFTATGQQNVNLQVITSQGCLGDTTKPINLLPPPTATIASTNNAFCEGNTSNFTATVNYDGPGTVNYFHWNFGNGVTITPTNNGPQSTTFPTNGTYTVKYVAGVSPTCVSDTATQVITVYSIPKPAFTFSQGCLPSDGIVQFTNTSIVADSQGMTYNWNFGDANATPGNPNTSTDINPQHNFALGTYSIKLTATTPNGCTKDTTITTTFNVSPEMEYPALASVCASVQGSISIASGTVTNGVTGTGIYNGQGTTAQGNFTPSLAGPGIHTIWYVFTSNGGCKDSISSTIKVHPKPIPAFTFSQGCLPSDGIVQFTNTSTVADSLGMTYNWNFGDANATPGNPNTSTDINPQHNFALGIYSIKLTATTPNGCTKDTTITTTFNVSPEMKYPALASVCASVQGSISIASGTVTNGVTGTGIYKGPGTTAQGNFSPSAAGPGTHTIWYVFTSNGGCKDSIASTVKVHPKPVSTFTVSSVCQGETSSFTNASTISSGNISSWNWNFGDGNNASYTNGSPFTRTYGSSNNFTVKLVTVSDSSCTSDTAIQTVNIHPLPVPNFTMPTFICMPNGNAVFTNTSTISGGGSMNYQWNFGDASAGSSATNPSHVYTSNGPFNISLTTTSPFGCIKDTTKVLDVFYDKPVADFTVTPTALCQGTPNSFVNQSYAPNSTVTSWSWTFGDGTVSNLETPTKTFANPGEYNVTLVVKNAVGCTSDPFRDTIQVYLQPVVDAGPSFVVPEGTIVKFNPIVNDSVNLSFLWTPSGDFPNPSLLRPNLQVMQNQTYTLTAIGEGNCTASDTMNVKILKLITVPNSFSPNGDGINDQWVITNLAEYPGNRVEVYNRYGQIIFQSKGYGQSWDGTYKGSPLPFATYYYIITLNNGFAPVTGSVTIVR